MSAIYKSERGAQAVRERYLQFLDRWPVPSERITVPTREGETFVLACGPKDAPPLLLFHGSGANATMWLGRYQYVVEALPLLRHRHDRRARSERAVAAESG